MKIFLLSFLLLFVPSISFSATNYLEAASYTPVFNSKEIVKILKDKKVDSCGQYRELEFIALPKTIFKVEKVLENGIYEVSTKDYFSNKKLYVEKSTLTIKENYKPKSVKKIPPDSREIIKNLLSKRGLNYQWGGNVSSGIDFKGERVLKGVDCSGLLYEATKGVTPRNSVDLLNFGSMVEIENKSVKEITNLVKPLDLIVWKGHVIIVLDKNRVIESILRCSNKKNSGVIVSNLEKRLSQIIKNRKPIDIWDDSNSFVIRRWIR